MSHIECGAEVPFDRLLELVLKIVKKMVASNIFEPLFRQWMRLTTNL